VNVSKICSFKKKSVIICMILLVKAMSHTNRKKEINIT